MDASAKINIAKGKLYGTLFLGSLPQVQAYDPPQAAKSLNSFLQYFIYSFDTLYFCKTVFYFMILFNPPMVKPFRLTYLAKEGVGVWLPPPPTPHPPLEILTIASLTFCLLLTDRPTLGVPEYKLKVVNICKMHATGGLEVVVLCAF